MLKTAVLHNCKQNQLDFAHSHVTPFNDFGYLSSPAWSSVAMQICSLHKFGSKQTDWLEHEYDMINVNSYAKKTKV
jgi:hypothetical protein